MTNTLINTLIPILILVESNGNDQAVGDGGLAAGCLQIHQCVIDDVNRVYGTEYVPSDRIDRECSIEIAGCYLAYWGRKYEEATGGKAGYEELSRIWNGGPAGWQKKSTDRYWEKVREML